MEKNKMKNQLKESFQHILNYNKLNEEQAEFKMGDIVTDINGDNGYKVLKVYPNKKTALDDLKKTLNDDDYNEVVDDVNGYYQSYRPIGPEDDKDPWYILDGPDDMVPYLIPAIHVGSWDGEY